MELTKERIEGILMANGFTLPEHMLGAAAESLFKEAGDLPLESVKQFLELKSVRAFLPENAPEAEPEEKPDQNSKRPTHTVTVTSEQAEHVRRKQEALREASHML